MIYAISDTHGDYKQAVKLLQREGVIDADANWIADDSTLICAGDSTDRGPDGIKMLKFWKQLTEQAKEQGGRVIHLMGNHDALILCIAIETLKGGYDYEHAHIFRGNGGKMHEATSLSRMEGLRVFVQNFPGMCLVDGILFQHCDGFDFYREHSRGATTPEERIQAVNKYVWHRARDAWGAWNLFYDLTDNRFWSNSGELMPEYLEDFGAKIVVHGHTGFKGDAPMRYLDDMVINIDAIMSRGYRSDENRGCVLVIDSPGKDIVV